MKEFYERVRQAVAALPGVTSVSLATSLPLFQNGPPDLVAPEGQEASKEQWSPVSYNMVEDNYFSTLGLPVLSGRTFDPGDTTRSPEVVVINRTLAHKYWPEQDPLGKRLRIRNGNRLVQIVGVAGDSKYDDLGEPETPFMYFAIRQHPHDATDLALIARTSGQPRLWIEPVRDAIHKVNPSAFSFLETTMEDQINLSLLIPKIIFACVSGFGMLALVLSMAGLYATTSYSVRERRKEIGIRLALGAQPRRVMATLLRQATQIAAIGLILGIGMGVALSSGVSSLLYGVRTVDPVILIAVPAMTAALAVVTTYLAARQSLNVDPLEAVRHM